MRSSLKVLSLILISFVLSCSGEIEPKSEDLRLGNHLDGCLTGFQDKVGDFFAGKSSEKQINDLFDCHAEAIRLFARRVKGSQTDKYLPSELKTFLEDFFLKDQKLSDGLVREVVALHGVMLGSPNDHLSQEDLVKIIEIFDVFRKSMLKLLPYMPITAEHLSTLSYVRAEEAISKLKEVGIEIAKLFENAKVDYPAERLKVLASEVAQTFTKNDKEYNQLVTLADLVITLKPVLFKYPKDVFLPGDWKFVVQGAFDWYAVVTGFSHLLYRNEYFLANNGFYYLQKWFDEMYRLFYAAVESHPNHVIPFKYFDEMIAKFLLRAAPGQISLSQESLQQLVRVAFKRVLAGRDDTVTGRLAEGVGFEALERFKHRFYRWMNKQYVIREAFERVGEKQSHWDLNTIEASSKELLDAIDSIENEGRLLQENYGEYTGYLSDLKEAIKMPTVFALGENIVSFDHQTLHQKQNYYNLTTFNWLWEVYRSAFIGYADPKQGDSPYRLHREDFKSLFLDIRQIGVELKAIDPRIPDSSPKRLREANLFSTYSNGDDYFDIQEGVQVGAYMLSIVQYAQKFHREVVFDCRDSLGPIFDTFGNFQVKRECFREKFFSRLDRYWKHIPLFKKAYDQSNQKEKYQSLLMEIASQAQTEDEKAYFTSLDTNAMFMFLLYFESAVARFDVNQDDHLDVEETVGAFRVLKTFIIKAAGNSDEEILLGALMQAMSTGSFPEKLTWNPSTWTQAVKFYFWKEFPHKWKGKVYADRLRFLEIMVQLKTKVDLDK